MTTTEVLRLDNFSYRRTRRDAEAGGLSLALFPGEYRVLAPAPGFDVAHLIPLITGEAKLVSGSGTLLGYPLRKMSARRRRQLLQQTGILPRVDTVIADLTLDEFLALPLRISGMTSGQIENRVRNIVTESGLLFQMRQPMSILTPSQLRLAGVAQALIKAPRLVIAELRNDEFDCQVTAQILQKYSSHGGAVLALIDRAFPMQAAGAETTIRGEVHAAF